MPTMPRVILPNISITTPSLPEMLKRSSIVCFGRKCISLTASATSCAFTRGLSPAFVATSELTPSASTTTSAKMSPFTRSVRTPTTRSPSFSRSTTVVSQISSAPASCALPDSHLSMLARITV